MIPQQAIDLAKRWEGFHRVVKRGEEITAVPYVCPAGFWTIGYGHLCSKDHTPITESVGETYLINDLWSAYVSTLRWCPVLAAEPETRLAAIVDFTFNLGGGRLQRSTLRHRVNQRNWSEAAYEINRWVYGGGRKLPGLIARRAQEAELLLNP